MRKARRSRNDRCGRNSRAISLRQRSTSLNLVYSILLAYGSFYCHAFTTISPHRHSVAATPKILLYAGGFEWEDPEEAFDQGVENPFKKVDDNDLQTIDPARLLSPRLNGSNLYLVGMMGSGKSTVGQILAKREYKEPARAFRRVMCTK